MNELLFLPLGIMLIGSTALAIVKSKEYKMYDSYLVHARSDGKTQSPEKLDFLWTFFWISLISVMVTIGVLMYSYHSDDLQEQLENCKQENLELQRKNRADIKRELLENL